MIEKKNPNISKAGRSSPGRTSKRLRRFLIDGDPRAHLRVAGASGRGQYTMLAEDHNGKRFHYAATNPMTGFELRVDGGLHSERHLFLLISVVCAFPSAAFLGMTGLIVVCPQR